MSVHAQITLRKDVTDLDQADDWFAEVTELLTNKTTCKMRARSSNRETPIDIVKDPEDG